MSNIIVRVNKTNAASGYAGQSGYYSDIDLVNDKLIWTAGSDAVSGYCGYIPTSAQLDIAASIITASPVEVAKCFLADVVSGYSGDLIPVIGMGSNANQYVFCFSIDGATATEPTLEAWDDSDHDSTLLHVLGYGTPNDSMIHAICTTSGAPSSGWSGVSLAGANVVNLNDSLGALSGAKDLYSNIYIKIPASYPTPESSAPVITVRYTYV